MNAPQTTKQKQAECLIDQMLSAQSQFATTRDDNNPLTEQEHRCEVSRDHARAQLMEMIGTITETTTEHR